MKENTDKIKLEVKSVVDEINSFYERKSNASGEFETIGTELVDPIGPYLKEISEIYHYCSQEHRLCKRAFNLVYEETNPVFADYGAKEEFVQKTLQEMKTDCKKERKSFFLYALIHFLNAKYNENFKTQDDALSEIKENCTLAIQLGFFEFVFDEICRNIEDCKITKDDSSKQFLLSFEVINSLVLVFLQLVFSSLTICRNNESLRIRIREYLLKDNNYQILFSSILILVKKCFTFNIMGLFVKRIFILLRAIILATFGGYEETRERKKVSKTMYKWRDSSEENPNVESAIMLNKVVEKRRVTKIRRHQLEEYISNHYLEKNHFVPRYVPLDSKYFGCSDQAWNQFQEYQKFVFIPLYETQCDSWEEFLEYPFVNKCPPLPPSEELSSFFIFLKKNNFSLILVKFLFACLGKWSEKKESVLSSEIKRFPDNDLFDYGDDMARHRSILLRNLFQIILLLMKHFKSNHIFQHLSFLKDLFDAKFFGFWNIISQQSPECLVYSDEDCLQLDLYSDFENNVEKEKNDSMAEKVCFRGLSFLTIFINILDRFAKFCWESIPCIKELYKPMIVPILAVNCKFSQYYASKLINKILPYFSPFQSSYGPEGKIYNKVINIYFKYFNYPSYMVDLACKQGKTYRHSYRKNKYDISNKSLLTYVDLFIKYILERNKCDIYFSHGYWISRSLENDKSLQSQLHTLPSA